MIDAGSGEPKASQTVKAGSVSLMTDCGLAVGVLRRPAKNGVSGGMITDDKYSKMNDASKTSAIRNLKQLHVCSLLVVTGVGKNTR